LISSRPIFTDTLVSSSSGQIILTSTSSPTDFPLIFKNRYSISKVGKVSTLIPLVRMQFLMTFLIAEVICFVSELSKAITNTFSSLTKKGLYRTVSPLEGNSSS